MGTVYEIQDAGEEIKGYGQKLVNKGIITVEEFYEVGYIGWFFIMIFGI